MRTHVTQCVRPGFTLVEVILVSALSGLLVVLLAQAWSSLGRPLLDVATRSRLAHEANLAAASLSRDLGGSLADNEGRLGGKTKFQLVGRMQPDNSQLWLCFDGGPSPNGIADWEAPDTVVSYYLAGHSLIRWNQGTGTSFTVAEHVESLEVQGLADRVEIRLTFRNRSITQTYILVAENP